MTTPARQGAGGKLGTCDYCTDGAVVIVNDRRGCLTHLDNAMAIVGVVFDAMLTAAGLDRATFADAIAGDDPDTSTTCRICGLTIRRIEEADRPWVHDDPAYDPFSPPIHAPRPRIER